MMTNYISIFTYYADLVCTVGLREYKMETKSGNPKKNQQQKRSIEFNFVIKTCCKQSQSPNDKSYSVCGNKLSFYTH